MRERGNRHRSGTWPPTTSTTGHGCRARDSRATRVTVLTLLLAVASACATPSARPSTGTPPPPPSATTTPSERAAAAAEPQLSQAGAEFQPHIDAYLQLRRKALAGMPAVPRDATPEQVDAHQRQLLQRIAAARPGARPGDIFSPAMQVFVRQLLGRVFSGPTGAQLRDAVMDENPMDVRIAVNGRYPDTVPLSTMPAEVLESLPQLPEDLEYRFVGNRLVLMDVPAHLIVDFMSGALPAPRR